ncbi:MAG: formylglycine-generating enzyme family protein [Anaerolineales bacterium]|nr:formylglycine-generating enzyme family protein [Anaerolineales bacterium]
MGYLGDPRLGEMVTIPTGKFLMGDDESTSPDEKPQHKLFLPEYQIGKYPLTNAEYRRFIEARGYNNKRWWTDAGWERIGQQQNEPRYWQATNFNRPNQPIVGVTWYECVAYCRWLSAETGLLHRLPTEAEWEKTARGIDGRQYPWGNRFETSRLNSIEGEQAVQVTTPVGIYPMGVSTFGACDCAGNVWELCITKSSHLDLKPYPYNTAEGEEAINYLTGTDGRTIRGGSWLDFETSARCTGRAGCYPDDWNGHIGCRLVSPIC